MFKDVCFGDVGLEMLVMNFEIEILSLVFVEMYKRDGIYGGYVILLSKDEVML